MIVEFYRIMQYITIYMLNKYTSHYINSISLCILMLFQAACAVINEEPAPYKLSLSNELPKCPANVLWTIAFPQEFDSKWVQYLIEEPFCLAPPLTFIRILLMPTDDLYVLSILPYVSYMYYDVCSHNPGACPKFPWQLYNVLKEMIENGGECINTLTRILSFYNEYRMLDMWNIFWLNQKKYAIYEKDLSILSIIYGHQRGLLFTQASDLHKHLMQIIHNHKHKQNKNSKPLSVPLIQSIDKGEQNTKSKQRWADLLKEEQEEKLNKGQELSDTTDTSELSIKDRRKQQQQGIHTCQKQSTKPQQWADLPNQEQEPKKSERSPENSANRSTKNPLPTDRQLSDNRINKRQRWKERKNK